MALHRQTAVRGRPEPVVVIDGKYGVSGAQPAGLFLRALETAWAESQPLAIVSASDASGSCESVACAVPA